MSWSESLGRPGLGRGHPAGSPRGARVGPETTGSEQQRDAARVYLARHGRTQLNAAGRLRGHLDVPLDLVGQAQARSLGARLGHRGLQVVVASPLRRAVETARAVAEAAGLEVEIDRRFVDRDYGSWAGQARESVVERWGSLEAAPGVEPARAVLSRAWEGLADLAGRVGGGAGLVVSHDAVNRLLLEVLDPDLGAADTLPQDTGCYNVLERRQRRWSVLGLNLVPDQGAGTVIDFPGTSRDRGTSGDRDGSGDHGVAASETGGPGEPGNG